jgi:hypothetical protein
VSEELPETGDCLTHLNIHPYFTIPENGGKQSQTKVASTVSNHTTFSLADQVDKNKGESAMRSLRKANMVP